MIIYLKKNISGLKNIFSLMKVYSLYIHIFIKGLVNLNYLKNKRKIRVGNEKSINLVIRKFHKFYNTLSLGICNE